MRWMERMFSALRFFEKPAPFELLEREKGKPGFWSGWPETEQKAGDAQKEDRMPATLKGCEAKVKKEFFSDINSDAILRHFRFCGRLDAICVLITGMADDNKVNDFVIREAMKKPMREEDADTDIASFAMENVFTLSDTCLEASWREIRMAILDGKSVVFIEGADKAVVLDTRGAEHRAVSEPQNEKTIRGPKESYTENLRTNITLLRRMVRMPAFVCEFRNAGAKNGVKAAILYRGDIVNQALLGEVKRRLAGIDTDMLLSMGSLEQLTEQRSLSVFPQILSTERPDRTARYIMQGHVVLLLEGSPFASIMPATLFSLMASAEDSYLREPQGTIVRAVRFAGALASTFLPGYFISLTLYHQGLLPAEILITIINSRKMVYASIGAEMLFLLAVFQLIREAGMRIPGTIGQTIGIMGGLLLGQAAISANLASSVILIIVAISALGNFCIPDYEMQIAASYLRVGFVIAAWMGGLLGFAAAMLFLLGYMSSLKSYGVPFLAPYSPKTYYKQPMIRRGRVKNHHRAEDYVNTEQDREPA